MKIINHIQLVSINKKYDTESKHLKTEIKNHLDVDTGEIKTTKVFSIKYNKSEKDINKFANDSLKDPIIQNVYINRLFSNSFYKTYLFVSKLPGVTDDEGLSAQETFRDYFNIKESKGEQFIFSGKLYYFENDLSKSKLDKIANELLGNPLINHFEYGKFKGQINYFPNVNIKTKIKTETINIFVTDEELEKLSEQMLLSLNLKEMTAIKEYFSNSLIQKKRKEIGLTENPTDCELEILGQTWSEHCKHKEFNAIINYKDPDTNKIKKIDSLFKTYIYNSTNEIKKRLEKAGQDWLIKVFNDNAGVVKIDSENVFIWKVETHNSPSALDPYGGALTGTVGVNRDPLGTGIGGGKLLFNTNVLCFGSPQFKGKLLTNQLHPRRIMSGVIKGIEDGGNKSGIPTINGSIFFDDRYRGKPLVFAGTGAVMPYQFKGRNSWEKNIDIGDRIFMLGGRVGKDGIHGATFSSLEIDDKSPRSAVQIGSPITQKKLSDFMQVASEIGLIKCSTDNGAGGLSSSIGELAEITNGAKINLEKVPLKYSGLQPWEIFISESQERMTLVIEPENVDKIIQLSKDYEVELTDIGSFNSTGFLEILFHDKIIAFLDLNFLHNGLPQKVLEAEWEKPKMTEPKIPPILDYNEILLKLVGNLNICSREPVIRKYDHEVKGKTIIKQLMGENTTVPQDAGVMRLNFNSYAGIAISNGINPLYGDIDAYEMSAGAFDEAVRQIISVGGKLPNLNSDKNNFWSVNDNFCVPDSVYDTKNNPDGKYKLAQLVNMNEALFDMSTFFNIPMTSGKDSMKNDFKRDNVKISIPPTILYSMVSQIEDVRKCVTSDFKKENDLIYLVGKTYNELGGSVFYQLFNELGANVPKVRKNDAKRIYEKMMEANSISLIESSHDISNGGLAVTIIESAFDGNMGADISLMKNEIGINAELFSESHSRFVVSIQPKNQNQFEKIFGNDCKMIGKVTDNNMLRISENGNEIVEIKMDKLLDKW
ncbi:MAG: AIR synthase-related protein, partial [Candidatus Marinimicrobia bacterium]|nr:AIR synthase-related protein [Candidatus Neomarinimicrobiota bacterium]